MKKAILINRYSGNFRFIYNNTTRVSINNIICSEGNKHRNNAGLNAEFPAILDLRMRPMLTERIDDKVFCMQTVCFPYYRNNDVHPFQSKVRRQRKVVIWGSWPVVGRCEPTDLQVEMPQYEYLLDTGRRRNVILTLWKYIPNTWYLVVLPTYLTRYYQSEERITVPE